MIIMHCQLTVFLFTTLPDQSGRGCRSPRWPHEGDSKKVCLLGVGCPLWPGSPVRMRASTEDLPQVGRQEASLRRCHSSKDLKEVGARTTWITWRSFPRQREPRVQMPVRKSVSCSRNRKEVSMAGTEGR